MIEVKARLTPETAWEVLDPLSEDELEQLGQFELVDGEIVWLAPPKLVHNRVAMAILKLLIPFGEQLGAQLLGDNTGYRVGPENMNVRMPDISLITKERLHILLQDERWGVEAPDLAIEVLSPQQYGEPYARQKVPEYLGSGGKVVWLVNPEDRTVRVYEADKAEFSILSGDAEITLDHIASGFRANISAFFPK